MKKFLVSIEEVSKYYQTGTVEVRAKNKTEAIEKVMRGEFIHLGDNKIDYNSEELVWRKATPKLSGFKPALVVWHDN